MALPSSVTILSIAVLASSTGDEVRIEELADGNRKVTGPDNRDYILTLGQVTAIGEHAAEAVAQEESPPGTRVGWASREVDTDDRYQTRYQETDEAEGTGVFAFQAPNVAGPTTETTFDMELAKGWAQHTGAIPAP